MNDGRNGLANMSLHLHLGAHHEVSGLQGSGVLGVHPFSAGMRLRLGSTLPGFVRRTPGSSCMIRMLSRHSDSYYESYGVGTM